MPTNDNHSPQRDHSRQLPDPHAHAALLLVESLIHGLCEDGLLSRTRAIEIAETAIDVQKEVAEVADGASALMWRSYALLTNIAASLRADEDGGGRSPSPRLVT